MCLFTVAFATGADAAAEAAQGIPTAGLIQSGSLTVERIKKPYKP